uniref:WD repeat domain 54 n=1 Tax=Macaca nemestrina TaxID=9545 RepID=A0A2K6CJC0_MACNE
MVAVDLEGPYEPRVRRADLGVHWCVLPFRVLLVLTSHRGIQMYESNGYTMVYWHALDSGDASPGTCRTKWGRGRECLLGLQEGIFLIILPFHIQYRLCLPGELLPVATSSDCVADMVTADDSGLLCVWRSGPEFTLLTRIPGFGVPCPSVQLWQGIIAAGYGNGQVHLYEAATGNLHVQINAHARAICALDLAPEVGKLLSAGEDTFVHIWKLSRSPDSGYIEVSPLP